MSVQKRENRAIRRLSMLEVVFRNEKFNSHQSSILNSPSNQRSSAGTPKVNSRRNSGSKNSQNLPNLNKNSKFQTPKNQNLKINDKQEPTKKNFSQLSNHAKENSRFGFKEIDNVTKKKVFTPTQSITKTINVQLKMIPSEHHMESIHSLRISSTSLDQSPEHNCNSKQIPAKNKSSNRSINEEKIQVTFYMNKLRDSLIECSKNPQKYHFIYHVLKKYLSILREKIVEKIDKSTHFKEQFYNIHRFIDIKSQCETFVHDLRKMDSGDLENLDIKKVMVDFIQRRNLNRTMSISDRFLNILDRDLINSYFNAQSSVKVETGHAKGYFKINDEKITKDLIRDSIAHMYYIPF